MKVVLLLSALLAFAIAEDNLYSSKFVDESSEDITTFNEVQLIRGTYETPLNHINAVDPRRLRLVYEANVEFYEEGGPLFFFFGDHGSRWLTRGLVFDLAREFRGALISAPQRCFGRNRWANLTLETLEFCTFEHALSDVPHLINTVKENLDAPTARAVVWGARLGGSIAALARKKFPHIVNGAWSSSGVFRAVATETEFYNAVAWNLYYRGQQNCSVNTGAAFRGIQALVEARNGTALQRLFNLCNPLNFDNAQEVSLFYEIIFDYIHRYINFRHINGLREFCSDMEYRRGPVLAFGRWARHVFGDDEECSNFSYQNFVDVLSNPARGGDERVRNYIFCTHFGIVLRVTSDPPFANVFPDVVSQEFHDNVCSDILGDVFNRTLLDRAVLNFNLANGAQNQIISSAIFSNGNLDPYLSHGISEYDVFNSEAVNTQYTSGAADLESISDLDTAELTETKRTIIAALTRFAVPDLDVDPEEPEEPEDGDDLPIGPLSFRFN